MKISITVAADALEISHIKRNVYRITAGSLKLTRFVTPLLLNDIIVTLGYDSNGTIVYCQRGGAGVIDSSVKRLAVITNSGVMQTIELREGYQWDGASGPVIQDKAVLCSSGLHDLDYQVMRIQLWERLVATQLLSDTADMVAARVKTVGLIHDFSKQQADNTFKGVLQALGTGVIRSNYMYLAVKYFGASSCKPGSQTAEIRVLQ